MKILKLFTWIKEKFSNFFKSGKKSKFLIIAAALIMTLIVISIFFPSNKSKKASSVNEDSSVLISDYAKSLETKLEDMLLKLDQVESVSVLVILESTVKNEYLMNSNETTSTTADGGSTSTKSSEAVFEKSGSTSKPVIVSTTMPKVVGVLIVVNKIDASTKNSILSSVSTVLNLNLSSISILQES